MKKAVFIVVVGILTLLLVYFLLYFFGGSNKFSQIVVKDFDSRASQYLNKLDGTPVLSTTTLGIVAVMVDNHPDARPQSGIAAARVVYEVPVEGNFTRFLAIYNTEDIVEKVGPVRSARPYYLDWLREYGDALYLHCGGSPDALSLIKKDSIFAANEFYWGDFYWRDQVRTAPHNLYTDSELWQKLWSNYGKDHGNQDWQGWKFGEISVTGTLPSKGVSITYASNFQVTWQYNIAVGQYSRLINNQPLTEPVLADNVVVQYVKMRSLDELDRKEITTIGSGDMRIWRDGVLIRGTWSKGDVTSRTRFFDNTNQEINLHSGVTWIQIVPESAKVEINS
ncbi:MAG: hypothetical protein UR53_C0002G0078 [Candidatus Magasanikbacteria bacterium GW2011_GWC2_34_16]|uniref:PT repeat-containing protein n=2 Tax=Candidatus Magasanikiibacteriota TaxID=1752731 RepID=A0A0G0JUY7_9BACT|nr:MAG: hypothetical protein UR53_C0002G0078 [Candidatus Magasanikbacteria bacterium GW2011_GWC2_34_16]KKQ40724.1 MAG: hypothetical protein US58_C0013G0024 [Candidatus Magasanikbacteria bacterium GW2011_GWA2_37_8]